MKKIGKVMTLISFIIFDFILLYPLATGSEIYLAHLKGDSMKPTSHPNNIGLCISKENYEVGEFVSLNKGVSHRIVKMNETHVWTKGDNNDYIDQPTKKEGIRCEHELVLQTGRVF